MSLRNTHQPIAPEQLGAAAAYSAEHRGLALLVLQHGQVLYEAHAPGHPPEQALPIASGTKSFCGVLAAVAAADGFFSVDERLAKTLTEWAGDPRKSRVTVRQLLQLVSGLEGGGKAGHVPQFEAALQVSMVADPNQRFFYGAAPFQVFGEFARRTLERVCTDPLDYFYGRVLDRIGLHVGRWRRGADGWPDLSSGVLVTAREWAKLGELIRLDGVWDGVEVVPKPALEGCFVGSTANPAYGLGWWLNRVLPAESCAHLKQDTLGLEDLAQEPVVPPDLVYAAGAGKQRLYISRSHGLVIVRQAAGVLEALAGGERSPFSDTEFFHRLLGASRSTST